MKRKYLFFCFGFTMSLAFIVCIGSAVMLIYLNLHEYSTSQQEYNEVAENFVVHEDSMPEYFGTSSELSNATDKTKVKIDHASLRSINSDYVGWLYIPVLDISYPVVQGTDNDYYLTHTFQKTENKSGAIFVDSCATSSDFNCIFYGHSMKDGSMFQRLKKFSKDLSLCSSNPEVYFYTDNMVYQFQIYSYYPTTVDSDTYMWINDNMDYKHFVDYTLEHSEMARDENLNYNNRSITLSTCYGSNPNERYVVHAILKSKEVYY